MGRTQAILAIGFLVLAVTGGSRFAIGLTLKPMAETLELGRGTLSLAVTLFLVVSSLCIFLSGHLSDRWGLKPVLLAGLALSAAGIGLISVVAEPWQALLLYGVIFAVGNGLASIAPIGVLITRWFPGRTALANSVAISGMGVGQLVMIALLALVLAQSGWRPVYFWLGIANLALFPLVLIMLTGANPLHDAATNAPADTRPSEGASLSQALRRPHYWLLLLVYAICGCQDFFVATHVVALAQDRGAETLLAGNLLALMGLTGLVGVILTGLWSDRAGPLPATIGCFAIRTVLFVLVLASESTLAIAVFALAYGFTFWITAPLTVVFARNAYGLKSLGALTGFITMLHHMAGGLGAYVGAALFDAQGTYALAFVLMAGLSVVGGVASLGLRTRRAR